MRDDSRSQYDYNMDISRTLAQRGGASITHMGSNMGQYSQDINLLSPGGIPATYRGSGYAGVGAKGYYMGTDWTDTYAADGAVDYGLSCPTYAVISSDPVHMNVGYGHWTSSRQKNAGQTGGVYMDSESGYSYGGAPSTSLVHRPAVTVGGDTSAYSFSSIAASLPTTTNERLLPSPVSRAQANSSGSYRPDSGLLLSYGAAKPSHGSTVSAGAASQTSPELPISDVATAAAVASYAGAAYDYATSSRSSQHHSGSSGDAYTPASSGAGETIFGDSDRTAGTQGSAVDLTAYTYGGASPAGASSLRRPSSGSGLLSRAAADSSTSGADYMGADARAASTAHAGHTSGAHLQSAASSSGHHQHQDHHPHYHHASSHHVSPRHGGHHLPQQHHAVPGGTAYGESSSSANLIGRGVGNTAAAMSDSHRTSVTSRR